MNRRQTIPPEQKYTVKQFQAEFPNDSACLDYMMQKRWRVESRCAPSVA